MDDRLISDSEYEELRVNANNNVGKLCIVDRNKHHHPATKMAWDLVKSKNHKLEDGELFIIIGIDRNYDVYRIWCNDYEYTLAIGYFEFGPYTEV